MGLDSEPREVCEVNKSWWFAEKFGYRTVLKIAVLLNWSGILGLKVKKQI